MSRKLLESKRDPGDTEKQPSLNVEIVIQILALILSKFIPEYATEEQLVRIENVLDKIYKKIKKRRTLFPNPNNKKCIQG